MKWYIFVRFSVLSTLVKVGFGGRGGGGVTMNFYLIIGIFNLKCWIGCNICGTRAELNLECDSFLFYVNLFLKFSWILLNEGFFFSKICLYTVVNTWFVLRRQVSFRFSGKISRGDFVILFWELIFRIKRCILSFSGGGFICIHRFMYVFAYLIVWTVEFCVNAIF